MSQANSAIHGPYRRKVTLACGSCRKRRVKCSGNQPCTLCSESGRVCEFDNKKSARRGPRPRRNVQSHRIVHQLAARLPSCEQVVIAPHPQLAVDPVWQPQEETQYAGETEQSVTNVETEDNDDIDDDDDDDVYESAPDPLAWKPGLEDIFSNNDINLNIFPALDIDFICHLIHVFCTRASAQLRSLLSPAQIQHQLSQGSMSLALVLAVCASSMRFTVHKAAKGLHAQRLAETMEREARKYIHTSNTTWQQVNNIKTICVLVDYEASRGHGRQAWIDIALGRSLMQLAKSDCELDTAQTQALVIAERFLAIAQVSHCLGHRHLQPTNSRPAKRPRLECAPCPEDCPHLIELLEVLASIYQLCLIPFKEHNPLPWTPESEFRALQDELEEYLLRHPSTFRFGSNSPSGRPSRLGDLDASISSMVWHCCVIILNRTFLPIPERRAQLTEDGVPEQPIRCFEFPEAPPLFLKERINRCESSADAICDISKDVIRNGGFYSHALFVGYACTQSALVSINRLHRSPRPYDNRIVENLKLAFIILGALKTFYAPAKDWMDVLFRAHDTNTRLRYAYEPIVMSFNSYFSRFIDLDEPIFMPIDRMVSDTTSGDTEMNDKHDPNTSQSEGQEVQEGIAGAHTAPEWLQAYAGHLSGDIETEDHNPDEGSRSPAVHVELLPLQANHDVTQITPAATFDMGQGQGIPSMEPDASEVSQTHMASAILTSMSGGTMNYPLYAQEQHQLPSLEYDRHSMNMNSHDGLLDFFTQTPDFAAFPGLGPEMPIFPGLESIVGESDMWSDIFNLFPG